MLPIGYGNFLRKNEQGRGRYELIKPRLNILANCALAFGLFGVLTVGSAYAYEYYMDAPGAGYSDARFRQCQALNKKLMKAVAEAKQLKPYSITDEMTKVIMAKALHPDVALTGLDIRDGNFTVTGQVESLSSGDEFAADLGAKSTKNVSISKVSQKNGYIEFTMNIKAKKVDVKKTIQQAGKGGGK